MRWLILLVVGMIGAVGGYLGLEFRRDLKEKAWAIEMARQAAEAGIGEAFWLQERMALDLLVVTPEMAPGEREFRARVQFDDERRAVFGRAEATCEEDLDRGSCWRITAVEIDGVPVAVGAARVAGMSLPAVVSGPDTEWTTEPTEDLPVPEVGVVEAPESEAEGPVEVVAPVPRRPEDEGAAATPDAATAPIASTPAPEADDRVALRVEEAAQASTVDADPAETPAPATVPAAVPAGPATHQVSNSFVNARSAPEVVNGNVVAVLRAETRLRLTERQGAWGRFAVVETPGGETPPVEEVWIALRLTAEL